MKSIIVALLMLLPMVGMGQVEMYGVKVSQKTANAYWTSLRSEPDTLWWLTMQGRIIEAETFERIKQHCIGAFVTDSNYKGYGVDRTIHYIVEREPSPNDFTQWMLRYQKRKGLKVK